jgi:hypothetical protein
MRHDEDSQGKCDATKNEEGRELREMKVSGISGQAGLRCSTASDPVSGGPWIDQHSLPSFYKGPAGLKPKLWLMLWLPFSQQWLYSILGEKKRRMNHDGNVPT